MPGGRIPSFSVIIPSRLRHDRLAACLRSLIKSDYPRDRFDVIVVDQNSGMPPRAVLAPFAEQLNLAMIELASNGMPRALNAGARHARGDYLVFMNEDCACTSDWMAAFAAAFALDEDGAVIGRTVNALPGKLTSEASQAIFDYHSLNSRQRSGRVEILSAVNLAVPAKAYREIGGFDESEELSNGSEREFSDRWLRSGRSIRFLPDAVVLAAHTPSLSSFLKAHFARGSGACQLARKRESGEDAQNGAPEPGVRELMHYPFERRAGWRAPFLAILVGIAESARSLGYRSTKWHLVR